MAIAHCLDYLENALCGAVPAEADQPIGVPQTPSPVARCRYSSGSGNTTLANPSLRHRRALPHQRAGCGEFRPLRASTRRTPGATRPELINARRIAVGPDPAGNPASLSTEGNNRDTV
jgi:hypothetical protein